ncbi:hypothetical protein [Streptomyces lutosisoli]|uniref:Nudix hydrolase domain-containing protein n=1 Tax=Streptomyces lutosisoli TaxID=2665721 RepID=A0ABW2VFW9_9ACTN
MTRQRTASAAWREARFRQLHGYVSQLVACLIAKALEEQSGDIAVPGLPLLTRRGWIPRRPLPLDQVQLNYSAPRADTFAAAKRLLAPYWPAVEGMRVPTYSAAVHRFAKPPMFFNAPSFRLLSLDPTASDRAGRSTALQFTMGSYYDWIDTGEALGFEAAKRYAESGGASIVGPCRESLRGPFDFAGRCATPGINTLTIRASRRSSVFYLHRRTSVATARGTVHVVPAGEFQPSGGDTEGHAVGGADLDVRSTIIREYMEEILGRPDVTNPMEHVTPVDFMSDPDYAAVESALRGGGAQCHYLGTGLYPLTWKPEILMVCVFEERLFDRVFAEMHRSVDEGDIEGPGGRLLDEDDRLPGTIHFLFGPRKRPYQGLPFDEETVEGYANDPTTLPAARACLKLAWQHRGHLNIPTARP